MYNRQAHARTTITLVLLCIFGWRANAQTHCVCLFVSYSFCHSSLLSLSLSISETNSYIEYDYKRQRCAYIYMWATRFSNRFSFLLPSSSRVFFSSTLQSLFFCHLVKHTYTQSKAMKEKNQLGNNLLDFSFFLSFVLFFVSFVTQIYNSKKRKTHPITTITNTDDLYTGIDDARRRMRLH
jgi:hypothetical protein